ncbi:hypothetical protein QR680_014443 [Steinernema hermaphroditum]|uniref:Uncharacterized protein n=1 Tax=Steinernema hermaphroditum TaxID=289476 RepID=A0AA39IAB1_9BILA|nr:hypothetical protein QR680_014443 [Steinernema hermaphroditum]
MYSLTTMKLTTYLLFTALIICLSLNEIAASADCYWTSCKLRDKLEKCRSGYYSTIYGNCWVFTQKGHRQYCCPHRSSP